MAGIESGNNKAVRKDDIVDSDCKTDGEDQGCEEACDPMVAEKVNRALSLIMHFEEVPSLAEVFVKVITKRQNLYSSEG